MKIPLSKEPHYSLEHSGFKLIKLLHLRIANKAREIEISKPDEQEKMNRKTIEMNPKDDKAYLAAGWYYRNQGDYDKAREMFKKAIEINPQNDSAYVELGWCYMDKQEKDKAAKMYRKAIGLAPENVWAHVLLGWQYRNRGEYEKAEEMWEKAIKIDPENDGAQGILGHWYQRLGKHKLAEGYFNEANRLRLKYYSPITRHNYQKLAEVVTQRGIKLVCVQYPVRSVEPLKKMIEPYENIIFVDNEGIFKEAVKREGYDEYFIDILGRDFGHCTLKGNRLLAGNIADVILKEVFNK